MKREMRQKIGWLMCMGGLAVMGMLIAMDASMMVSMMVCVIYFAAFMFVVKPRKM
jgi:hypothetical protein